MWKFIIDVVHDFVSSLQPDVGRGFLHVSNVFLLYSTMVIKYVYHHSVAPWVFVGKLKASMYTLILQIFVNIKYSYVNNDSRIVLQFLAATKQLYKWYFPSVCPSVRLSVCLSVRLSVCPSVRLSVRLSHLFDYVPINVSS